MPRIVAALMLTVLFTPIVARADTTGALNGAVSDSADEAPLANVTVVANSRQEREEVKTDQHGSYVFLDLLPGLYTVTATRAGYEPFAAGVAVRPGSEVTLKIALVRMLKTVVVDCFCPQPLFQPSIVPDEYRIRHWNAPSFDFVDSAVPLLFSVPGITFGMGPRMMR